MKCQTNQFNCPVEATLSLIGGKYKPLILWHLIDHPLHYMELQRLIPNATPKMLSQQLHDLENNGMIHREVIPEKPPKTVYSLTPLDRASSPFWTRCANGETAIWTAWMCSRHAVKAANKMLGIADEKRLCPAYIFCSKFVTAGRNCTARQSQHGDSYLKSVAGFPRPFDAASAFSDRPSGRRY